MLEAELWIKAAVLACGGKLAIPDSALMRARKATIHRYNDAHGKEVVFEVVERADSRQQSKADTCQA